MKYNIHDFEIMAPVGSRDSLQAAIQAGANSVYFGVGQLNMRSHSANPFTIADLREIAAICNEHGIIIHDYYVDDGYTGTNFE